MNGLNFKEEYSFKDLLSNTGRPLRFDFAVFDDEGNFFPVETQEEWDMIDEVVGAFIEDSEEE